MCPPNAAPTPAGPKRHKSLKCSISDRGQNRPPQQAPHGWQPFLQLFYFQLPNIHLGNEITHSFLLGVGLLPLTAGPVVRFFFYFLHRHHHEAVEGRFIYGVADRDAFVPALLTPDFSSPPRRGCTKLDRASTQFGHSGAARRRRNRRKTPAAALRVRALFALDVRPNS